MGKLRRTPLIFHSFILCSILAGALLTPAQTAAQLAVTPFDSQHCPPVVAGTGAVLPEGCSSERDTDIKGPPPLTPPPGCDPEAIKKQLSTLGGTYKFLTAPPECRITKDQ